MSGASMDQKQLIKTLDSFTTKQEYTQQELVSFRLEMTKEMADLKSKMSDEMADLKTKMAAMEVKNYVVFAFMSMVIMGLVGYVFKTNG